MVAHRLWQMGYQVEWTRHEQVQRIQDFTPPAGELRHLQGWAVEEMTKHHYGVLDIATRFGKSYTYAGWYVRMGRPMTLILVPRAAIAQQMKTELEAWLGEPVGIVAGTVSSERVWQNITVAIDKSLCETGGMIRAEHVPYLHAVEARLLDECHIGGDYAMTVQYATPNVIYSWAGSATPQTEDELKNWYLLGWYGPTRVRVSSKMLADRGILAHVDCAFHFHAHALYGELEWTDLYKSAIVNNPQRNKLIADIARLELDAGNQGLIFVNHVDQAHNIKANLPEAVIVASKLLSQKQAEEIRGLFNSGQVRCVIVTKKWREGVTVTADFGINAEGGRAEHVVVQKLGRGLLPKASGAALRWHDIWDSGQKTIHRHARARRGTIEREEWPVVRYATLDEYRTKHVDLVRSALIDIGEKFDG